MPPIASAKKHQIKSLYNRTLNISVCKLWIDPTLALHLIRDVVGNWTNLLDGLSDNIVT